MALKMKKKPLYSKTLVSTLIEPCKSVEIDLISNKYLEL